MDHRSRSRGGTRYGHVKPPPPSTPPPSPPIPPPIQSLTPASAAGRLSSSYADITFRRGATPSPSPAHATPSPSPIPSDRIRSQRVTSSYLTQNGPPTPRPQQTRTSRLADNERVQFEPLGTKWRSSSPLPPRDHQTYLEEQRQRQVPPEPVIATMSSASVTIPTFVDTHALGLPSMSAPVDRSQSAQPTFQFSFMSPEPPQIHVASLATQQRDPHHRPQVEPPNYKQPEALPALSVLPPPAIVTIPPQNQPQINLAPIGTTATRSNNRSPSPSSFSYAEISRRNASPSPSLSPRAPTFQQINSPRSGAQLFVYDSLDQDEPTPELAFVESESEDEQPSHQEVLVPQTDDQGHQRPRLSRKDFLRPVPSIPGLVFTPDSETPDGSGTGQKRGQRRRKKSARRSPSTSSTSAAAEVEFELPKFKPLPEVPKPSLPPPRKKKLPLPAMEGDEIVEFRRGKVIKPCRPRQGTPIESENADVDVHDVETETATEVMTLTVSHDNIEPSPTATIHIPPLASDVNGKTFSTKTTRTRMVDEPSQPESSQQPEEKAAEQLSSDVNLEHEGPHRNESDNGELIGLTPAPEAERQDQGRERTDMKNQNRDPDVADTIPIAKCEQPKMDTAHENQNEDEITLLMSTSAHKHQQKHEPNEKREDKQKINQNNEARQAQRDEGDKARVKHKDEECVAVRKPMAEKLKDVVDSSSNSSGLYNYSDDVNHIHIHPHNIGTDQPDAATSTQIQMQIQTPVEAEMQNVPDPIEVEEPLMTKSTTWTTGTRTASAARSTSIESESNQIEEGQEGEVFEIIESVNTNPVPVLAEDVIDGDDWELIDWLNADTQTKVDALSVTRSETDTEIINQGSRNGNHEQDDLSFSFVSSSADLPVNVPAKPPTQERDPDSGSANYDNDNGLQVAVDGERAAIANSTQPPNSHSPESSCLVNSVSNDDIIRSMEQERGEVITETEVAKNRSSSSSANNSQIQVQQAAGIYTHEISSRSRAQQGGGEHEAISANNLLIESTSADGGAPESESQAQPRDELNPVGEPFVITTNSDVGQIRSSEPHPLPDQPDTDSKTNKKEFVPVQQKEQEELVVVVKSESAKVQSQSVPVPVSKECPTDRGASDSVSIQQLFRKIQCLVEAGSGEHDYGEVEANYVKYQTSQQQISARAAPPATPEPKDKLTDEDKSAASSFIPQSLYPDPNPEPSSLINESTLYPFLPDTLAYAEAEVHAHTMKRFTSTTKSTSKNPPSGSSSQGQPAAVPNGAAKTNGHSPTPPEIVVTTTATVTVTQDVPTSEKNLAAPLEELSALKTSIDALINSLTSLKPGQLDETANEAKRIQELLAEQMIKAERLQASLNSLPKDSEVQLLLNQLHQLLQRLRTLQTFTDELTKNLTAPPEFFTQSPPGTPSPSSTRRIVSTTMDAPVEVSSTPHHHGAPGHTHSSSQSITFQNPTDNTCTMTSIEVSGATVPTREFTTEQRDASGSKIVTRVKQSGFVSQTKQVSTTHSYTSPTNFDLPADFVSPDGHSHPSWAESLEQSSSSRSPRPTVRSPSPTNEEEESHRRQEEGTATMEEQEGQIVLAQALPPPAPGDEAYEGGMQVTVKQVRQVVTRRIIRKRRRIIRRIIVVNGVEQVTEEVIEEPDEVDERTSEMSTGPMVDIVHGSLSRPVSPGVVISEMGHHELEDESHRSGSGQLALEGAPATATESGKETTFSTEVRRKSTEEETLTDTKTKTVEEKDIHAETHRPSEEAMLVSNETVVDSSIKMAVPSVDSVTGIDPVEVKEVTRTVELTTAAEGGSTRESLVELSIKEEAEATPKLHDAQSEVETQMTVEKPVQIEASLHPPTFTESEKCQTEQTDLVTTKKAMEETEKEGDSVATAEEGMLITNEKSMSKELEAPMSDGKAEEPSTATPSPTPPVPKSAPLPDKRKKDKKGKTSKTTLESEVSVKSQPDLPDTQTEAIPKAVGEKAEGKTEQKLEQETEVHPLMKTEVEVGVNIEDVVASSSEPPESPSTAATATIALKPEPQPTASAKVTEVEKPKRKKDKRKGKAKFGAGSQEQEESFEVEVEAKAEELGKSLETETEVVFKVEQPPSSLPPSIPLELEKEIKATTPPSEVHPTSQAPELATPPPTPSANAVLTVTELETKTVQVEPAAKAAEETWTESTTTVVEIVPGKEATAAPSQIPEPSKIEEKLETKTVEEERLVKDELAPQRVDVLVEELAPTPTAPPRSPEIPARKQKKGKGRKGKGAGQLSQEDEEEEVTVIQKGGGEAEREAEPLIEKPLPSIEGEALEGDKQITIPALEKVEHEPELEPTSTAQESVPAPESKTARKEKKQRKSKFVPGPEQSQSQEEFEEEKPKVEAEPAEFKAPAAEPSVVETEPQPCEPSEHMRAPAASIPETSVVATPAKFPEPKGRKQKQKKKGKGKFVPKQSQSQEEGEEEEEELGKDFKSVSKAEETSLIPSTEIVQPQPEVEKVILELENKLKSEEDKDEAEAQVSTSAPIEETSPKTEVEFPPLAGTIEEPHYPVSASELSPPPPSLAVTVEMGEVPPPEPSPRKQKRGKGRDKGRGDKSKSQPSQESVEEKEDENQLPVTVSEAKADHHHDAEVKPLLEPDDQLQAPTPTSPVVDALTPTPAVEHEESKRLTSMVRKDDEALPSPTPISIPTSMENVSKPPKIETEPESSQKQKQKQKKKRKGKSGVSQLSQEEEEEEAKEETEKEKVEFKVELLPPEPVKPVEEPCKTEEEPVSAPTPETEPDRMKTTVESEELSKKQNELKLLEILERLKESETKKKRRRRKRATKKPFATADGRIVPEITFGEVEADLEEEDASKTDSFTIQGISTDIESRDRESDFDEEMKRLKAKLAEIQAATKERERDQKPTDPGQVITLVETITEILETVSTLTEEIESSTDKLGQKSATAMSTQTPACLPPSAEISQQDDLLAKLEELGQISKQVEEIVKTPPALLDDTRVQEVLTNSAGVNSTAIEDAVEELNTMKQESMMIAKNLEQVAQMSDQVSRIQHKIQQLADVYASAGEQLEELDRLTAELENCTLNARAMDGDLRGSDEVREASESLNKLLEDTKLLLDREKAHIVELEVERMEREAAEELRKAEEAARAFEASERLARSIEKLKMAKTKAKKRPRPKGSQIPPRAGTMPVTTAEATMEDLKSKVTRLGQGLVDNPEDITSSDIIEYVADILEVISTMTERIEYELERTTTDKAPISAREEKLKKLDENLRELSDITRGLEQLIAASPTLQEDEDVRQEALDATGTMANRLAEAASNLEEIRSRMDAEAEAMAKAEAETMAKAETEAMAKAEAETMAKAETEAMAKVEAEEMAKAEAYTATQQTDKSAVVPPEQLEQSQPETTPSPSIKLKKGKKKGKPTAGALSKDSSAGSAEVELEARDGDLPSIDTIAAPELKVEPSEEELQRTQPETEPQPIPTPTTEIATTLVEVVLPVEDAEERRPTPLKAKRKSKKGKGASGKSMEEDEDAQWAAAEAAWASRTTKQKTTTVVPPDTTSEPTSTVTEIGEPKEPTIVPSGEARGVKVEPAASTAPPEIVKMPIKIEESEEKGAPANVEVVTAPEIVPSQPPPTTAETEDSKSVSEQASAKVKRDKKKGKGSMESEKEAEKYSVVLPLPSDEVEAKEGEEDPSAPAILIPTPELIQSEVQSQPPTKEQFTAELESFDEMLDSHTTTVSEGEQIQAGQEAATVLEETIMTSTNLTAPAETPELKEPEFEGVPQKEPEREAEMTKKKGKDKRGRKKIPETPSVELEAETDPMDLVDTASTATTKAEAEPLIPKSKSVEKADAEASKPTVAVEEEVPGTEIDVDVDESMFNIPKRKKKKGKTRAPLTSELFKSLDEDEGDGHGEKRKSGTEVAVEQEAPTAALESPPQPPPEETQILGEEQAQEISLESLSLKSAADLSGPESIPSEATANVTTLAASPVVPFRITKMVKGLGLEKEASSDREAGEKAATDIVTTEAEVTPMPIDESKIEVTVSVPTTQKRDKKKRKGKGRKEATTAEGEGGEDFDKSESIEEPELDIPPPMVEVPTPAEPTPAVADQETKPLQVPMQTPEPTAIAPEVEASEHEHLLIEEMRVQPVEPSPRHQAQLDEKEPMAQRDTRHTERKGKKRVEETKPSPAPSSLPEVEKEEQKQEKEAKTPDESKLKGKLVESSKEPEMEKVTPLPTIPMEEQNLLEPKPPVPTVTTATITVPEQKLSEGEGVEVRDDGPPVEIAETTQKLSNILARLDENKSRRRTRKGKGKKSKKQQKGQPISLDSEDIQPGDLEDKLRNLETELAELERAGIPNESRTVEIIDEITTILEILTVTSEEQESEIEKKGRNTGTSTPESVERQKELESNLKKLGELASRANKLPANSEHPQTWKQVANVVNSASTQINELLENLEENRLAVPEPQTTSPTALPTSEAHEAVPAVTTEPTIEDELKVTTEPVIQQPTEATSAAVGQIQPETKLEEPTPTIDAKAKTVPEATAVDTQNIVQAEEAVAVQKQMAMAVTPEVPDEKSSRKKGKKGKFQADGDKTKESVPILKKEPVERVEELPFGSPAKAEDKVTKEAQVEVENEPSKQMEEIQLETSIVTTAPTPSVEVPTEETSEVEVKETDRKESRLEERPPASEIEPKSELELKRTQEQDKLKLELLLDKLGKHGRKKRQRGKKTTGKAPILTRQVDVEDEMAKLQSKLATIEELGKQTPEDVGGHSSNRTEVEIIEEVTEILDIISTVVEQLQAGSDRLRADPNSTPEEIGEHQEKAGKKLEELYKAVEKLETNSSSIKDENVKARLKAALASTREEISEVAKDLTEEKRKAAESATLLKGLKGHAQALTTIKTKLQSLDPNTSAAEQLHKLAALDDEHRRIKSEIYDLLESGAANDDPKVQNRLRELSRLADEVEAAISSETQRLLQDAALSAEYEDTLDEFTKIIQVAKELLAEKPRVHSLDQFRAECNRRRKFFGNLKRCQQTLEKLEYTLDPATREANRGLHKGLYDQATEILLDATKQRQKMAVAVSRWQRLEQGLEDEFTWLRGVIPKIPNTENIPAADASRICTTYQSLYSDVIVHQARLWQLTSVCGNLQDTVECPELQERSDHLVDNMYGVSTRVTNGLQSLVGFNEVYASYEKLMQRLRNWLQGAETKMDAITLAQGQNQAVDPLQFWELKAQLLSQEPLRREVGRLLEHALTTLSVSDEAAIRENYENFDERWSTLAAAMSANELVMDLEPGLADTPVGEVLDSAEKAIGEARDTLANLNVLIESEDDLYQFLEKMQMLKATVLSKNHQLRSLLSRQDIEPEEAERISILKRQTSELHEAINDELEAGHTIREKISTFARMCSKTKRVQDNLTARVDQWTSFFELSQDILKQALSNCQNLDSEITDCEGDVQKMDRVLASVPSTPHVRFSPVMYEAQIHELEATLHTLSARIQDLKKRVQNQLGLWQDYEHALNTAAVVVHQNASALEVLRAEPPTNHASLDLAQRYLQSLRDSASENRNCVERLVNAAKKLQAANADSAKSKENRGAGAASADSASAKESQSQNQNENQIETAVRSVVDQWTQVEDDLKELNAKYTTCEEIWTQIETARTDIEQWVQTTSISAPRTSEEVALLLRQGQEQEKKMNELQALVNELCAAIYVDTTDTDRQGPSAGASFSTPAPLQPLRQELEALSAKLADVKSELVAAQSKRDMEKKTKQKISTVLNNLAAGKEINTKKPEASRLDNIREDLVNLGKAQATANQMGETHRVATSPLREDEDLLRLLQSSQTVFHETFAEYLRVWDLVGEREDVRKLYRLWQNHLEQIRTFLQQPIPDSKERLLEDDSLCSLYSAILNHKSPASLHASAGAPGTSSSGDVISYESLDKLQKDIETQLIDRQAQVQQRLNAWNSYRNAKDSLTAWLQCMEKEKRALELPFLQLQRIPGTQAKVENLLTRCRRGAKLLEDCNRAKGQLVSLLGQGESASASAAEIQLLLAQDISTAATRLNNLEAALRTWLDHISGLSDKNEALNQRHQGVEEVLDGVREAFNASQHLQPPTTFNETSNYILQLKDLQRQLTALTPVTDELHTIVEELKPNSSPSDARAMTQRHFGLSQQIVDLQTTINSELAAAQEKVDMVPRFDTKCRAWLVWADGMIEKIERPKQRNLEEYKSWLGTVYQLEIHPKQRPYDWLLANGTQLATMTTGLERQEVVKALEQLELKWKHLNQAVQARKVKAAHLMQVEEKLAGRVAAMVTRLRGFEAELQTVTNLPELSLEALNQAMRALEAKQRDVNNESGAVNQLFNLSEIAANDCEDIGMFENSIEVRQGMKRLYDLWNQLISSYQQTQESLHKMRDEWKRLAETSDYIQTILTQADSQLQGLERSDPQTLHSPQGGNGAAIDQLMQQVPEIQTLQDSLAALAPQIDDLRNSYCYYVNRIHAKPGSDRTLQPKVKKTCAQYNSLLKRCDALIKKRSKLLSLAQFRSAYFQPAQEFLQNIGNQVEALSVASLEALGAGTESSDSDTDPELALQLLEHLKEECDDRGRELEEAMRVAGQSACELDTSLKSPIHEQLDSYNLLKKKLEALFTKIMKENEERNKLAKKKTTLQAEADAKAKAQIAAAAEAAAAKAHAEEAKAKSKAKTSTPKKDKGEEGEKEEEPQPQPPPPATHETPKPRPSVQFDSRVLTREDIYNQELDSAVEDAEQFLETLGTLSAVAVSGASAAAGVTTASMIDSAKYDDMVKTLAQAQASVDMVQHLDRLVSVEREISSPLREEEVQEPEEDEAQAQKFARNRDRRKSIKEIEEMVEKVKEYEGVVRSVGQKLREGSPSKKAAVICPVCSPQQRSKWDSTLWRLQQWLQHSEASLRQAMRRRPSVELEELENAILRHRELLLDLDSHRSLVVSLQNVLEHLRTHDEDDETMDADDLRQLKERLEDTIEWWKKICHNAALWQARLQMALIENSDFHLTVEQYEDALNHVQNSIQVLEPVHLDEERKVINRKLRKFKDLSSKLTKLEPNLMTLQQTAEQLFVNPSCIENEGAVRHQLEEPTPSTSTSSREASPSIFTTPECKLVLNRIANLNQQLRASRRVCDAYVRHLSTFLEQNPLENVAEETLDQSESSSRAQTPSTLTRQMLDGVDDENKDAEAEGSVSEDEEEPESQAGLARGESALLASGRMAYRALRASLPLQAFMVLLLGLGALLPYSEQDYSCFSANTFARSFETMLHYPNGPPPI